MIAVCAWCCRRLVNGKPVGCPILVPLPNASHGICRECRERVLREERVRVAK